MSNAPTTRPSRRAVFLAGLAAMPMAAQAASVRVITMLGDSITAGYGLPRAQALPVQLETTLRRRGLSVIVRGAGVSGDTTAGGLARVDFSVLADTDLCIVALGGNDLLQGIDPRRTQVNLERIVERLQMRHIKVLLAGLKAPGVIGLTYARDFQAVFPAVARRRGAILYPDLLAGVARDPRLVQKDGLHPNADGARLIAERLAPVVAKTLSGHG